MTTAMIEELTELREKSKTSLSRKKQCLDFEEPNQWKRPFATIGRMNLLFKSTIIDNNLSWKHHIDHAAIKMSRTVRLICELRHFLPRDTLKLFIDPLLPLI